MIYDTHQLEKLKAYLPVDYLTIICKKIDNKISIRQIQYVINGTYTDKHNIIEYAVKLALKEKAKQEKLKKQIDQL